MNKNIIKLAIAFMCMAIILGAFLKHALNDYLSPQQLSSFETGIKYQLIHSLSILIIGFNHTKVKSYQFICLLFFVGICFFSFSIYLLSCKEILNFSIDKIWIITPLGGLFFIVAWIKLFFSIKTN
jgi:uncharacterized membrane protein YgdD (TMEM256/DUF423 family)